MPETIPDDINALKVALVAEREARQQAEARASGAEAMVAHYKLLIAKLRREQYGQSSERGRKLLDQLELQLEEAVASAAEDEAAAAPSEDTAVRPFTFFESQPLDLPPEGNLAIGAQPDEMKNLFADVDANDQGRCVGFRLRLHRCFSCSLC